MEIFSLNDDNLLPFLPLLGKESAEKIRRKTITAIGVVADDHVACGYLLCTIKEKVIWLTDLLIAISYRREGYAMSMIDAVCTTATESGYVVMASTTRFQRVRGMKDMLTKLGFTFTKSGGRTYLAKLQDADITNLDKMETNDKIVKLSDVPKTVVENFNNYLFTNNMNLYDVGINLPDMVDELTLCCEECGIIECCIIVCSHENGTLVVDYMYAHPNYGKKLFATVKKCIKIAQKTFPPETDVYINPVDATTDSIVQKLFPVKRQIDEIEIATFTNSRILE